jgi:hypothetical protein
MSGELVTPHAAVHFATVIPAMLRAKQVIDEATKKLEQAGKQKNGIKPALIKASATLGLTALLRVLISRTVN